MKSLGNDLPDGAPHDYWAVAVQNDEGHASAGSVPPTRWSTAESVSGFRLCSAARKGRIGVAGGRDFGSGTAGGVPDTERREKGSLIRRCRRFSGFLSVIWD